MDLGAKPLQIVPMYTRLKLNYHLNNPFPICSAFYYLKNKNTLILLSFKMYNSYIYVFLCFKEYKNDKTTLDILVVAIYIDY